MEGDRGTEDARRDLPIGLRWYVRRLRAMPVAEVALRSYRAARMPLDRLRMRLGRYARPSAAMRARIEQWQGPEPFYFARASSVTPVSRELLADADAICAGRRRVLGLGWLLLPPNAWHYEPARRAVWPRVDATRVMRAAPSHFDPRLTWELNRGHEWVVLARVYAATRDPRVLDRLVGELASWRRENPLGIGINWASAMEAAIRIHSLVWCAGFLRDTTGVLPTLAEAIYEHARFVAEHRSYFSSANNHLVVELSALIVAALTLGGELASLHRPALARLGAELDRQIHADGVSAEMATHYHAFVLEALLLIAYLQRAHAMPLPDVEAVIERMADYLAAIRCDDSSLLAQGDNDDGCILGLLRSRHADQLLAAAAALRAGHDATPGAHEGALRACGHDATPGAHEGAFWITGGAMPPLVDRAPVRSRRFEHGGQIVVRSPRLHAALDAGPFGFGSLAAHAHCDMLAITLAVDGRRVLVDRGTCSYRNDRDRYRLTAAHNTAQIGSLEQAAPAGAFLWSRRPTATLHRCELTERGDIVQASHDGFVGWSHRRTLVRHGSVLAVVDEFLGAGDPQRVVSRYHFAPELALTGASPQLRAASLAWLISNASGAPIIASDHSDEYGRSTSAPTLELATTTDRALIVVIGPADLPQQASIDAIARFAAGHGVHVPALG